MGDDTSPSRPSSQSVSMSGVGTVPRAVRDAVSRHEHLADLRRARAGFLLATTSAAATAIVEPLHMWAYEGFPLVPILVGRAVMGAIFAVSYLRMRLAISERELSLHLHLFALVCAVFHTWAAIACGQVSSYYGGAVIVSVGVITFFPRHARRNASLAITLLVGSVVTALLAALVSPAQRAFVTSHVGIVGLVSMLVAATLNAVVCLTASHLFWSVRREVFAQRTLGRYELRRRLGKGGMGEVWAAWHKGLSREVAVKVLRSEDPVAAARFLREVRATAELTHPNTVRVLDSGISDDGLLFYAMELLEGEHLGALVRREGTLPATRAVHLMREVARALAEAHGRGIVHRDLKPENVFVMQSGAEGDLVKVLDFGIARIVEHEETKGLTAADHVAGTPSTMSPEVLAGRAATPASDVYAIGVMLYRLLVGEYPFDRETAAATMVAHLNEPAPNIRHVAARNVPEGLARLVMRCLAKAPEARYRDGGELADALATCLSSTAQPSQELQALSPVSGTMASSPSQDAVTLPTVPRPREERTG